MTLKLYTLIGSNSACLIDRKYQSWAVILWGKKKKIPRGRFMGNNKNFERL